MLAKSFESIQQKCVIYGVFAFMSLFYYVGYVVVLEPHVLEEEENVILKILAYATLIVGNFHLAMDILSVLPIASGFIIYALVYPFLKLCCAQIITAQYFNTGDHQERVISPLKEQRLKKISQTNILQLPQSLSFWEEDDPPECMICLNTFVSL